MSNSTQRALDRQLDIELSELHGVVAPPDRTGEILRQLATADASARIDDSAPVLGRRRWLTAALVIFGVAIVTTISVLDPSATSDPAGSSGSVSWISHQAAFFSIAGAGCLVGALLARWGARKSGFFVSAGLLLGGVLVTWLALLAAVLVYFSIWQSTPNPPDEAFADGASSVFVLFFGWLPAAALCGVVFVATKIVRRIRRGPAPTGASSEPPPTTGVRAHRNGTVAGVVLVGWAVGFTLLRSHFSPLVFWVTFVAVGFLIVAIPSWWAGRRAKQDFLRGR